MDSVAQNEAARIYRRSISYERDSTSPLVIAMVGLPARGKSYVSRKLCRYLNWIGIRTKVFNVGEYRRKNCHGYMDKEFFNPSNAEGEQLRDRFAFDAFDDLINWLKTTKSQVAIFDATNSTKKRRDALWKKCCLEFHYQMLFIENICTRKDVIESNVREVKVTSPDYVNVDANEAVKDFLGRIEMYEKIYEEMDENDEENKSFIKIINIGETFVVNRTLGHLQSRIAYFLMNMSILPNTIYLMRSGETINSKRHRLGGDESLNENGVEFGRRLAEFMRKEEKILNFTADNLVVWTSRKKRSIQTAKFLQVQPIINVPALNHMDHGVCEGKTIDEIKLEFHDQFEEWKKNPYFYRFTDAENYNDLIVRLEPVIMEIERQPYVAVVTHSSVVQCLLTYFGDDGIAYNLKRDEVPLHTIYRIQPKAYANFFHFSFHSIYSRSKEILQIFIMIISFFLIYYLISSINTSEDNFPTDCEVCDLTTKELTKFLSESGTFRSAIKLEELKESICENFLKYSYHAEKKGIGRFAPGRSQTMNTLHKLKDRGVKVELGIPEQKWDLPSIEIENLRIRCDSLMEEEEDIIDDWYFGKVEVLFNLLCKKKISSCRRSEEL
ncbi:hypothetical protein SNEBB_003937 [Seison nebaliae]|nr:hypothetical protein SNEBB_003937 [Seison nebaliae]